MQEIAQAILEAPHTVDLDEFGAVELARIESLIEALHRRHQRVGGTLAHSPGIG